MLIKKLTLALYSVLLLTSTAWGAFPTTGILDNFNRTNEGPPPSASWDYADSWKVVSNQCTNTSEDWGAMTSPEATDVEGYMTIITLGDTQKITMSFRINGDNGTQYGVGWQRNSGAGNDVVFIERSDPEWSFSTISSTTREWATGYKLGFSAIGSTIKVYTDEGAGWVERLSVTDSNYTDASVIEIYGSGGGIVFDDFGGGNYVASARRVILISEAEAQQEYKDRHCKLESQTEDSICWRCCEDSEGCLIEGCQIPQQDAFLFWKPEWEESLFRELVKLKFV